MASSNAGRRRREPSAAASRSGTTSDFDSLRRRDSASIWATRDSGNRTVNVFMTPSYYITGICAIHRPQTASSWRQVDPAELRLLGALAHMNIAIDDLQVWHAPEP